MKLIVNADDFGYSHEVNLAIVEAYKKNLITNATIMVNMPGFDEAVELSKENGFFNKVGLHLNFYEGQPLSKMMLEDSIFIRDGEMCSAGINQESNLFRRLIELPTTTVNCLQDEARAQIAKYYNSGFTENHLDTHGHAHVQYAIWKAIYPEIKSFRTVRKTINFYANRGLLSRVYKSFFNAQIDKHFVATDYFTSGHDFLEVLNTEHVKCDDSKVMELMVHPIYIDGKLGNLHQDRAGSFEQLSKFYNAFSLISYCDI